MTKIRLSSFCFISCEFMINIKNSNISIKLNSISQLSSFFCQLLILFFMTRLNIELPFNYSFNYCFIYLLMGYLTYFLTLSGLICFMIYFCFSLDFYCLFKISFPSFYFPYFLSLYLSINKG